MKYFFILVFVFSVFGCRPADPAPGQEPANASTTGSGERSGTMADESPWVNRVWIRQDSDDRPGVLRIFLADGTLVMDSCWETYRLADWEPRADSVVVWHEDTAQIEAHLKMIGPRQLQVRLMLPGGTVTERYREADVPYVCPGMKR